MNMPRQKKHTPYGGKYEALRCKTKTPTAEGASHRCDSMPLTGVTHSHSHLSLTNGHNQQPTKGKTMTKL